MGVVEQRAILHCWERWTNGSENSTTKVLDITQGDNLVEAIAENRIYENRDEIERRSYTSIRQLLEGMTLTFDPRSAGELAATIQFNIGAPQAGDYYLRIGEGCCTFCIGQTVAPTLTINTPSSVWFKIATGELNAQQALMQGLYKACGDLSLLLRMSTLFKQSTDVSVDAPRKQRPAGPIGLAGITWMTVAFVPVTLYWILFNLPINPWFGVGLPLLLSLIVIGYRLVYDRPTWLEIGIALYLSLVAALQLLQAPGLARWGGALGSLAMGSIWLSSLLLADMPVSGEYSKWSVIKPLWRLSLFIQPNAVISLMWGWQFLSAAMLGMASILLPNLRLPLIVAQYGLIAPASWFTAYYQKGIRSRRISDVDKAMRQIQMLAAVGLGIAVVMGLVAVRL
jgi:putative sterol carrier protein